MTNKMHTWTNARIPAWLGINAPCITPDGRIVDSGVSVSDYEARVTAYESAGNSRSDSQAIVDCEILTSLKG